jgi:uncharacterized protein YjbI with pentapeptide repeats
MKATLMTVATLLGLFSLPSAIIAENFNDLSQLLSTKQCEYCDLTGSGLVMADLQGANLRNANLVGANLSQANLTGANLSGANLSGASLHGANLTGANLSGAILNGTDLRGAYLYNAIATDTTFDQAYMQGAVGIPQTAGTPELFYGWGLLETQKGNYQAALNHYNKALGLDPEFAPAYLARGLALFRLGNEMGAKQNAEKAAELFEEQEDERGLQTSQAFVNNIDALQKARAEGQQQNQLDGIVRGVASIVFQLLLP